MGQTDILSNCAEESVSYTNLPVSFRGPGIVNFKILEFKSLRGNRLNTRPVVDTIRKFLLFYIKRL